MKIKSFKYLVLFFVFTLNIYSQYDFNCSGYIWSVPTYQNLGTSLDYFFPSNTINKDQYSFFTKIRLRPVYNLWDDARLEAAAETHINIAQFANPFVSTNSIYSRQAIDMTWNLYNNGDFKVDEYIDRLFFKQTFDDFELTLGRQRINWGVGRVWQPTDRFHPINPANYVKIEKTGADAFSLKYFFGLFTDAEFVVNFRKEIKDYNYGLRIRTNFSPFTSSLILGYFDREPNAGFDISGNIGDAGVRAEGIYVYNKEHPDSSYVRLIVGADNQFTSTIYALIEFQYNGEGSTCKYCYDFMKVLTGQMMNTGVYYLAGTLNWQLHPLLTFSFNVMQNINDGSGYVSPILMWSALENLSVNAGGMFAYGSERTEFWYYPKTSVYLTAQFFF